MKRIITILAVLIIASFSTFADSEMKPKPAADVLSDIMQEQGVKSLSDINPEKVSKEKLEELGDSVMEAMIGNSELHEQMDKMMGGEGSASLSAMHQRIGYNYLLGYPIGMMNMMSGGMMGYSANNSSFSQGGRYMMTGFFPGMMGNFGWGFWGMFVWIIFLVLIIAIIFVVVKAFSRNNINFRNETPLDILKKRYARGEISKDDFEKIRNDLNG